LGAWTGRYHDKPMLKEEVFHFMSRKRVAGLVDATGAEQERAKPAPFWSLTRQYLLKKFASLLDKLRVAELQTANDEIWWDTCYRPPLTQRHYTDERLFIQRYQTEDYAGQGYRGHQVWELIQEYYEWTFCKHQGTFVERAEYERRDENLMSVVSPQQLRLEWMGGIGPKGYGTGGGSYPTSPGSGASGEGGSAVQVGATSKKKGHWKETWR